jgi:hypothetical protein
MAALARPRPDLESSALRRASNPGRPSPLAPSSPGQGPGKSPGPAISPACLLFIAVPLGVACGGAYLRCNFPSRRDPLRGNADLGRHGDWSGWWFVSIPESPNRRSSCCWGMSWRCQIRKASDTYTPPTGCLPWSVISALCNTTIPASPRLTISAVSRLPGTMAPATVFCAASRRLPLPSPVLHPHNSSALLRCSAAPPPPTTECCGEV